MICRAAVRSGYVRARGFTLIELLVVVAIIGMLIAILIPGLRLATEAGNRLICQTHLDQLFKGTMIFTEDHPDDRLPYFAWWFRPDGTEFWITEIAQAMETLEPEIFRCPSDQEPPEITIHRKSGIWHMADIAIPGGGGSKVTVNLPVTYRGSCDHINYETEVYVARRINDFTHPDQTMMLIEGQNTGMLDRECFRFDSLAVLRLPITKRRVNYSYLRHTGASNMVFMDGHVDSLTPVEVGDLAIRQQFLVPPGR